MDIQLPQSPQDPRRRRGDRFHGGANIGEEYLGRGDIGTWLDLHLELAGPSVVHLQRIFAEDWAFASGQPLHGDHYFRPLASAGDIVMQIVPSGPDDEAQVMHEAFFAAIAGAVERVHLMTPYFVPTEPLRTALETAARRGVEVEIIVPGTNTKPFVRLASHSYYGELLDAGVKIYEFTPGFLHAKSLTIDGRWSLIGTPNFDNRSLRLNFEVAAAIYDADITTQADVLFEATRSRSEQISAKVWRKRGIPIKVMENFARLFTRSCSDQANSERSKSLRLGRRRRVGWLLLLGLCRLISLRLCFGGGSAGFGSSGFASGVGAGGISAGMVQSLTVLS